MHRVRLIALVALMALAAGAAAIAHTAGPVSSCVRGGTERTCSFESTGPSVTVWGASTQGDVTSIVVEAVRYDAGRRVVLAVCASGGDDLPESPVAVPDAIAVPPSPVPYPTAPTTPPSPVPAPPGGQIDPATVDLPAAGGTFPAASCSASGSAIDFQSADVQCEARGSGKLLFGCYSYATTASE